MFVNLTCCDKNIALTGEIAGEIAGENMKKRTPGSFCTYILP